MSNIIVAGYEMPLGAKKMVVFDHYGPSSYANVSTSVGAGDVVNASDLNEGGFDMVFTGVVIAKSGNYAARVYQSKIGNGSQQVGANAVSSFQLRWFSYPAAATTGALGAEVANATDLSAEVVRLGVVAV